MWLQRWTLEQREYFLRQRALYRSIQRAIDRVYEKWPEAHRYEESSPKKYLYSKEGKRDFARVQEQIREEARNLPFSKSEFRVIALTEAAEKVLGEIRGREQASPGSRRRRSSENGGAGIDVGHGVPRGVPIPSPSGCQGVDVGMPPEVRSRGMDARRHAGAHALGSRCFRQSRQSKDDTPQPEAMRAPGGGFRRRK